MVYSMDYKRIGAYLLSLEKEEDELLAELREYAKLNNVPIIRRETESLLATLVRLKQPRRILEIGTAIGYSSIAMALACGDEKSGIVTIESFEKRIPIALENIKRAGLSDRIKLMPEDATRALSELIAERDNEKEPDAGFDFVFMDAAKGQYLNWLPMLFELMNRNAVLVCDNVLQDMTVMESRFTVERRERTIHERMRDFLYEIKHDERLESAVIPIGDGVSVSVFKG